MIIFRFLKKYLFEKDYNYKTHHEIYKIFGLKIKFKNDYLAKLEDKISANHKILNLISNVSKVPKASGELRKHQLECLNILSIVKNICEKNNLEYWLDAGTLLGAVRHKGMIPWDSDIDTGMMRNDAYKLIPLLKEEFKNTSFIVRETTGARNFQIRVCKKDNEECGIDIFPFDKYYKSEVDELERKEISKKIRQARTWLSNIHYILPNVTKDILKTRKIMQFILDRIIMKRKKCNTKTPAILFGLDFPFNILGDMILDYDTIFPMQKIEFEGELYSCPNNIHKYLVNYYGTHYMQYPSRFKISDDKIDEYIESLLKSNF